MTITPDQAANTPAASRNPDGSTRRLVVINAGTSNPSTSRLLADRVTAKTVDRLSAHGVRATVDVIDLGPLAGEIAHAIVSGYPQGDLLDAIQLLANADGVIVTTPVYKAGISGLLKAFIDILDNDLLIATPVVLAATAGSARHALVIDDQLRPLFAFMRSLAAPTSVFAAPEDWSDPALTKRIARAGTELAAMINSSLRTSITGQAWDHYQHNWGANARPETTTPGNDFNTDLMKLAAGGTTALATT